MSNAEMAKQLHNINRQQHKLFKAMQEAEQSKPRTKRVVNYPKAFFALNFIIGVGILFTNAVVKVAWLLR